MKNKKILTTGMVIVALSLAVFLGAKLLNNTPHAAEQSIIISDNVSQKSQESLQPIELLNTETISLDQNPGRILGWLKDKGFVTIKNY